MEEILIAIIHFIFECLVEVLLNIPIVYPYERKTKSKTTNLPASCLNYFRCYFAAFNKRVFNA